jgi:DNA gyrase/topoisomerase IV subunit A
MANKTQKFIKSMNKKPEVRTPIGSEIFLPNKSGRAEKTELRDVNLSGNDINIYGDVNFNEETNFNKKISIDQDANDQSIYIDSEATTADTIMIDTPPTTSGNVLVIGSANSLTTGSALKVGSASGDSTARNLVNFINDNPTSSGTKVLNLQQDSNGQGLFIDHNGTGISIDIDSESQTTPVFQILYPENTTGHIFSIGQANKLINARMISMYANGANSTGRWLQYIFNDHAGATGAQCLRLRQDAANTSFHIDHNANSVAIDIDSEATGNSCIRILDPKTTTANTLLIDQADALTSGSMIRCLSNSASTTVRNCVAIINENAAATGARGLFIRQDADTNSILIESDASTKNTIEFTTPTTTTGRTIDCSNNNSLTTGRILSCHSNSADTGTRALIFFRNQNSAATGATVQTIQQDANQRALFIDQNATGREAIKIDQNSNSTSDIYAIDIVNNNAGAGSPGGIDMGSFSADEPLLNVPADAISTAGTVSHQIPVNIGGTIYYLVAHTHGT